MTSLIEEYPSATHFVLIAVSTEGGGGFLPPPTSAYAWKVEAAGGEVLQSGGNPLQPPVGDWSTYAMLHAATEAVTQAGIPEGGHLHFISTLSFFTDKLNEDRVARRTNGYRRTNRKPLAYAEKWRELDAAFDKLNLTVSADAPRTDIGKHTFGALTNWAIEVRSNIGRDPSQWGVR